MSLALKWAAEATGHGVTYTLSEPGQLMTDRDDRLQQSDFLGWVDVTDAFAFNRYLGPPQR